MAIFAIKPISMSVAFNDRDSQPIQINKCGAYVDDVTENWSINAQNASMRSAPISKANPLLVTFRLPEQVCGVLFSIKNMSLSIRYRYNGATINQLECMLLPFVSKRYNESIGSNRSLGHRLAQVAQYVSRLEALGWEKGFVAVSPSAELMANFNGSIIPSTPSVRFIGHTDSEVSMPRSLELLRSICAKRTPLVTFAVFPNQTDVAQAFNVLEPASAAEPLICTLTISTGTDNADKSTILANQFTASRIRPAIVAKETAPNEFTYSCGIGINRNNNSTSNPSRSDEVGKYIAAGANLSATFLFQEQVSYNHLQNGDFAGDIINAMVKPPIGHAGASFNASVPEFWRVTSNAVTFSKIDEGMLIETYDSTSLTPAFIRRPNDVLPANFYWQYSSVYQNIGNLEEYVEYTIRARVKPFFAAQKVSGSYANFAAANSSTRLRLRYTSPYDPITNSYKTYYTDATFPVGSTQLQQNNNAQWQEIEIKVKASKRNEVQRINPRHDSTTAKVSDVMSHGATYVDLGGNYLDQLDFFGEVSIEVIPAENTASTTQRFDCKFIVDKIEVLTQDGKQHKNKGENLRVNLVGDTPSGSNTSMWLTLSDSYAELGSNDVSEKTANRWALVKRIAPNEIDAIGFPRTKNMYRFTPTQNGGKYLKGSHLILRSDARIFLCNPNKGSIAFDYLPLYSTERDDVFSDTWVNSHIKLNGAAKFMGGTSKFKPYSTNTFGDVLESNAAYAPNIHFLSLGSPKHIVSLTYSPSGFDTEPLTGRAFNGQLYSGTGVSFFRQGKLIYCLIYFPEEMTDAYSNQLPVIGTNSRRRQNKYILLKYKIPDNQFTMISPFDTAPAILNWFNVKLSWGARIELYVNEQLVDFVPASGLLPKVGRMVQESTSVAQNLLNTVWFGTIGMISDSINPSEQKPVIYTDNMCIKNFGIFNESNSHTKIASSISASSTDKAPVLSSGLIGSLTNA